MPIHRRNNDILTVEQLEELNSYQLLAEELNQSMTKYKDSDTIKSEV